MRRPSLETIARGLGVMPPKPGTVADLKSRFSDPAETTAAPAVGKYPAIEIGDTVSWKRQKNFMLGKVISIVEELESCLAHKPTGVLKTRWKYTVINGKSGPIESFIGSRRAVIEVPQSNGRPIYYVVPLLLSMNWRFHVKVIRGGGVDVADCPVTGESDGGS
ncbi:hypothetical protein [Tumebacillus permanentifrigoris]|uniref:Uncharacterized protein n=1 Tax=Tumebacillus permanentifrigoris TaxID=378543 RepID=A0A316D2V2_9BACL|nr:hypothetical protein [Tumebacillus permanentifrigoris]PWK05273.1 hypothetical protein C7459_12422 [Tumebacillus permanentifrigoris]